MCAPLYVTPPATNVAVATMDVTTRPHLGDATDVVLCVIPNASRFDLPPTCTLLKVGPASPPRSQICVPELVRDVVRHTS